MSIPAGLPSVFLPGQEQFTSYKSSLNELFMKTKQTLPIYTCEKKEDVWTSMVSYLKPHFGPNLEDPSKTQLSFPGELVQVIGTDAVKKASEHRAAYEALKTLKLLPGNSEYQAPTTPGNKRKAAKAEGMDVDDAAPPSKSPKQEISFKSLLQKFARKGIPYPEYRTVRVDNSNYFSTVAFNGVDFKGTFAPLKKQAEHNAAHMALYALGHEANPPAGYNKEADVPPKMTSFVADPAALKPQNGNNGFSMPPPQLMQQAQFVEQRGSMPYHGMQMQMPPQHMKQEQMPTQQMPPQQMPPKKPISTKQLENGDYKGFLGTYSQGHKLELPVYNVADVASGGFISTVTVSGVRHSGAICPKKRSAEASAAHFALYYLKQTEIVPEGFEEKCSNGVAPLETVPVNHKQKLHQYAQKEKLGNASYETTIRPDDKTAISTVTIGMRHYTGAVAANKKLAEKNAAAEACAQMMTTSS